MSFASSALQLNSNVFLNVASSISKGKFAAVVSFSSCAQTVKASWKFHISSIHRWLEQFDA